MKNVLDINDLSSSEIFSKHSENFSPFRKELLNLYKNYPNKNKIVTLLDYWIFNIFSLKIIYGQEGVLAFCESNCDNPQRFSFLYELSNSTIGRSLRVVNDSVLIFRFIAFFIRNITIPGARLDGIRAKLLNRVSRYLIRSVPLHEDVATKQDVFKLLDGMIGDYFSIVEMGKIKSKLPIVFFAEVVAISHERELMVEGSCASFLEFSGIENIFLLDNKLNVKGFQHGGGYDSFKVDYFVQYEKQISDLFVGWGFSEYNNPQHKYKRIKGHEKVDSAERKILWVEGSKTPSFYFASMPYYHYQSINKVTKSYIYNELKKGNIKYSNLYHPSAKSDLYDNFRRDDFLLSGRGASELLIRPSDILIFDNVGSSLIHFAIENDICFYKIIGRDYFNHFSEKQKEFFLMLRKYNLGFYDDEDGKFRDSMLVISSSEEFSLPSELVDFNQAVFQSNKNGN